MIQDILVAQGLKLEVDPFFTPERKPFLRIRRLVENRDYEVLKAETEGREGYHRLVCRCEHVTEAEIVSAIRRGHLTLDGIKYATRAGMGRCQGGFCTYRIMKIIEREAGIPFDRITKRGPGSEILRRRLSKGRHREPHKEEKPNRFMGFELPKWFENSDKKNEDAVL
jgi:glycerol-3-phosphate dehydrogenase